MIELLLSTLPFLFAGAVIGTFWRWSILCLLFFCAGSGFTFSLCLRDWSDFDFKAIMADADQGGGAWFSWVVGMAVYFIFSGLPAAVGGVLGYALRRFRAIESKH